MDHTEKQQKREKGRGGLRTRDTAGSLDKEYETREGRATDTEEAESELWETRGKGPMDPMRPRHRLKRTPPGKKAGGRYEPSGAGGDVDSETTDAGASSVASTDSKRKRVTGGARVSETDSEEESRKARRLQSKEEVMMKYMTRKKRREDLAEAALREAEALEIKNAVDPDVRAKEWVPGKNQIPINNKEVLAKKLEEEPVEKLKEIIGEQSNTLRKIAGSSKNLHGTYVRLLKTAAEAMEVVAIVMLGRIEKLGNEGRMLEANTFLMKKVKDLSEKNEALRQTTGGSGKAITMTI